MVEFRCYKFKACTYKCFGGFHIDINFLMRIDYEDGKILIT